MPTDSPKPARTDSAPGAPRVSIVIPVFNKLEFTKACLDALARHTATRLAEIIVVDNGSTDGTAEYLAVLEPPVRVVRNPDNLGFARACNLGAAEGTAPLVLFLNNDTEAHEHWLEPLLAVLDADPRVAAVGSKLLFPDGTLQHAGVMLVDDRKLPDPLVARHVHYGAPADLADANVRRCYQSLTAACLLVRKSAFTTAGGFDEGYWNGYEDIDLCLKLQAAGGLLVYEPASMLTHHESKSGDQRFSKVAANIARLHARWLGTAQPDGVRESDGTFTWTDALRIRDHSSSTGDSPPVSAGRVHGCVSIVILTLNQLEYTRQCVESIQRHTPEPHELVFVDNGSRDGTVKWLRDQVAQHPDYRLVENARNEGFARGCNQGIAAARGEYILLLNNDVVVAAHWLSDMLEALERTPHAGIVGPVTNQISGRQQAEYPEYTGVADLPVFAAARRERHRHQRTFAPRVVGFCMLMRASLLDRIGALDESFGTGNFEDDDLCLRAELAGQRNLIAADVFIHHYGSRTFIGNGIDHRVMMTRNRGRFAEKWHHPHATDARGRRVLLLEALEKAQVLDQTGRLQDAVELCLEAIRLMPAETTPYLALACMLVRAGHPKDALDVLRNLPSGLTDARARLLAARAQFALGEVAAAARLVDSVDDDREVRSRALNMKGLIAHQVGNHDVATSCFNAAIAADRGYGEPYAHLGALLWAREPGNAAFVLFEHGLALSPESPETLDFLCTAAKALGQTANAIRLVREARGLHPVHRGLTFALIDLLLSEGRHDPAMAEIENALEWFELEEGLLRAALSVRAKVGPRRLAAEHTSGGTLAVVMITKNEAGNLVRSMRSVAPVADEMLVLDTGSIDCTTDIAAALGAQVSTIAWTGDFAAARNASLAAATADWVLVLDADEAIAGSDLSSLRAIVRGESGGPEAAGYVLMTRNYTNDFSIAGFTANDGQYGSEQAGSGWYASRKVRLFRNDPRIRFEGALHEVVDDALHRNGMTVGALDIPVHHYGPLQVQREREKAAAYYELARKKAAATTQDGNALYELAVQAGIVGRHDEAVEWWARYVQSPGADRLALAHMNLGNAYLETCHFERAVRASREALSHDPECREAAYNLALAELCRGRYGETQQQCEKLLARDPRHAPTLALMAAASVLAKDDGRFARAADGLDQCGEKPAAALQACATRLRKAGRGGDVRRLLERARALWREMLTRDGVPVTDAQLDALITEASGAVRVATSEPADARSAA